MNEEQFRTILDRELTSLFGQLMQYFDARFDALQAEIEYKADGDRVYTALDAIAKRLDTDDQERVAMSAHLNRHDKWIVQASPKLGLKYKGAG